MSDKKLYNEQSIESLSPLEFTRLRPGVYAGDTTYSTQLLVEIISNAIDEFRLGHGNLIEVKIDKDIVSVRDYGQGFIPNSIVKILQKSPFGEMMGKQFLKPHLVFLILRVNIVKMEHMKELRLVLLALAPKLQLI